MSHDTLTPISSSFSPDKHYMMAQTRTLARIITCENSYQDILAQIFGKCLPDRWNGQKQQVKIVETVKILQRNKNDLLRHE